MEKSCLTCEFHKKDRQEGCICTTSRMRKTFSWSDKRGGAPFFYPPTSMHCKNVVKNGLYQPKEEKILERIKPSPPPKLTRAEAIAKTREQWGWLAHHPKMDKADYFNAEGISEKPIYGCYLCKWVRNNTNITVPSSECGEECLLSWPGGMCEGENGLHSIWREALITKDHKLATAVAYLIYRLPEKKE